MGDRTPQPEARPQRAMLFNEHGSQIFEGEEAIAAALEDGWSDAPVELAQTAKADDSDLASQVQELNAALANQHDEISAAKKDATEAKAALAKETERADAAEAENKKLAAALKRAKASASK